MTQQKLVMDVSGIQFFSAKFLTFIYHYSNMLEKQFRQLDTDSVFVLNTK